MLHLVRHLKPGHRNGQNRGGFGVSPPPTQRLTRDVVAVSIIKILVLAVIYVLFFGGTSHRLAVDTAAHIANAAPPSETR